MEGIGENGAARKKRAEYNVALAAGGVGVAVGIAVSVLASGQGRVALIALVAFALVIGGMIKSRILVAGVDWLGPPVLLAAVAGLYYLVRPVGLLMGLESVVGARVDIAVGVALGVASVVGFWVGYLLPAGEDWGASLPWPDGEWSASKLRVAVWGVWAAGVVCWSAMIYKSGGIVTRLGTYGSGSATGLGVLVVGSAALLGVAVVAAWLGYAKGLFGRRGLVIIAASSGLLLALHGQRGALLVALAMTVVVYHYLVRRLRGREVAVLGAAILLAIVVLGLPRLRVLHTEELAFRASDYARIGGWLLLRNLTSFDALLLTVEKVPREVNYQWGRSYVDAVAMVVPRQIYKKKPERNLFNRVLRKNDVGSMAMPLPAEGYLNFGLAGLLLEAVLLGIIYRMLYAYRARHQTNAAAILAYALGVAFFVFIWRGGLLGGHLGLLGAYAVLLAAVVLGCGGPRWLVGRK